MSKIPDDKVVPRYHSDEVRAKVEKLEKKLALKKLDVERLELKKLEVERLELKKLEVENLEVENLEAKILFLKIADEQEALDELRPATIHSVAGNHYNNSS